MSIQNVIESWNQGKVSLGAADIASLLKLAKAALQGGGVLPLDPRNPEHASHINARLGDDAHLSAHFPRKAAMLKATSDMYDLNGTLPLTLLQMTPEQAGINRFHPYVGIPHFALHPQANAVVATGIVSHPSILHALELVLEIVDADTGEVIGSTSTPPQFGSHYQRITVTAPLKEGAKPRRLVAGLTANYAVDGETHANPMLAAASLGLGVCNQGGGACITQVTPFAPLPVNHPGATVVKIATGVRDHSDVDYYYPNPFQTAEIIVPFSGQATLASGCSVVATTPCQTGSLTLINQSGGATYVLATTSVIAAFANSSGSTVTWSMGPDWQLVFPDAAGPGNFDITLQASLNILSGGAPVSTQLTVSSVAPPSTGGKLLPLNIMWGCVAPWTLVRMADGSERMICEIRAGDRLIADASGRLVEVERVITGTEREPMWRLLAGGCEVLATHNHPVMTPDGPVAIETLNVGDIVLTQDAPVPIEAIGAEEYDGEIRNLVLQSLDGAIPVRGDSFYGGGLLIGDNTMQNALAAYAKASEIPAEWQFDAANVVRQDAGLPLAVAV